MANDCNKTKPCGCEDQPLMTLPACNPVDCPTPYPCTEVTNADCVVYTGSNINCNTDEVVSTDSTISTALNNIVAYVCNALQQLTPQLTPGLFAQTVSSTPLVNTVTPGTLIGTGEGSLMVSANTFAVGDSFLAKFAGHMSANNNHTLEVTVQTNGVTLATTGVMTLPTITNKEWTLDITFTIRTIGAAGVASIASGGLFHYEKDASSAMEGHSFSLVESTLFNTTVDNTLEVIAEWGTADPGNSIYSEIFVLKKIY